MSKLVILVDCGHGADANTKSGKCSPLVAGLGIDTDPSVFEGRFREGNFNRLVAASLVEKLRERGYNAIQIVTEPTDIGLTERANRVNAHCKKHGSANCLLVSIHANAAGGAEWSPARGWLSIVDDCGSQRAKDFADMLFDAVKDAGYKTRQPIPTRKWYLYKECIGKPSRLTILSKTDCPAVLTENFFYTNKDEVAWLASPEGRAAVVDYHLKAIKAYAEKYFK